MKRLTLVPALVLLLLPLFAIYSSGGFRAEALSLSLINPLFSRSVQGGSVETAPLPVAAAAGSSIPILNPVAAVPAAPTPADPVPDRADTTAPAAWAKAPLLAEAVNQAMADFSGTYSIAVQDLASGERWVLGGEIRYHPASTIKMPVTLYALSQFRAGDLRWSETIQYTEADFESPGGGAFETAPFGDWYPVENLVNRALMYSNNVAVNMLGRRLGWNNIRAWSRSIGGELYRRSDGAPEVTVLSELGWWLHLEQVSREDPDRAALILEPLAAVAYRGRISAGLPDGVRHLHKFGSYDGYYHDGALIFSDHPYAMVVLTHGGQEHEADEAIARTSAAIYRVMN